MKLATFALAFGPPLLILAVKTMLEPAWLHDFSLPACIGIGAAIGVLAGIAVQVVEPRH